MRVEPFEVLRDGGAGGRSRTVHVQLVMRSCEAAWIPLSEFPWTEVLEGVVVTFRGCGTWCPDINGLTDEKFDHQL